ncbi:MAG TPA: hypothetical protein VH008_30880, partial [Pseudonocardia sp.]|nr:hypothetical protein [Pseudonocardia sp.]
MGDVAGGPRKSGVGLASCVLAAVATLWLGWLAVEAVVTETAAGQPILLIPAGTFVLLLWIPVLVLAQAGWVLRTGPARAAAAAAVRGRHAALGLGVLGVVGGLRTAPTGGALTGTAVLIGLAMLPLSWTLSGSAEELERWVRRNARPTAGQSASSASVDPDVAAESEPYPYP